MKRTLKVVAAIAGVLAIGALVFVQTGTVVRSVRKAAELKPNGVAERTRTADALDYSVAIDIGAPPPIVWALLTDAKAYPQWNSTVLKVDGTIAKAERIALQVKSAPDRTFDLKVSEFLKNEHMVWEDGGKMFSGVREFTLTPSADGTHTVFAMSETLSGRMLPMIEGSLPDFSPDFNAFARDLKAAAEKVAPPR